MIKLNLTAMTTEEIILKDYLENNASEVLAQKINNGVRIEKDGKTLINKKTLEHFMNEYAPKEAQKQAKQGARSVGIYKDAIFSWLIHYFEEDSIHGILYNLDGTEYISSKPVTAKASQKPAVASKSKTEPALKKVSMFDMINEHKLESFSLDEEEPEKLLEAIAANPNVYVCSTPPTTFSEPDSDGVVEIPKFLLDLFGDKLKAEVA